MSEVLPIVRPRVLVVDDDPKVGHMVKLSMQIDGADVISASSLAEGRTMLTDDLDGIVLDRVLPDGDGLDLLPDIARTCPDVPVVVYSSLDDGKEPASVKRVSKSDIASLFDVLGLGR